MTDSAVKRAINGIAILCTAILFSLLILDSRAFADQGYDAEETASYTATMLQSMASIPDYQEMYQFPDVNLKEVTLGEPVSLSEVECGVSEVDNTLCWPLYSDEQVVAMVITSVDDEGYTGYRLTTAHVEELQLALSRREVDVSHDGSLTVSEPSPSSSTSEPTTSLLHLSERTAIPYVEPAPLEANPAPVLDTHDSNTAPRKTTSASRAATVYVAVPKYSQGSDPICWATCVSSIGNYLTGQYIDNKTISNRVLGGVKGGTPQNAITALSYFTYPGSVTKLSGIHAPSVLPDAQIRNWIANGMPIYARLERGVDGNAGHAVVVCGYGTDQYGRQSAAIMNPGSGRYEEMAKNGAGLLSIYYAGNDYIWTRGTVKLTGWQKPFGGSRWAYMTSSGTRTTGWLQQGSLWYYFDPSTGYLLENTWAYVNGNWYYLAAGGWALTGWQAINGYWYAFDPSTCAMRTGWFNDGGTWYYLRTATNTPATGPEGAMLANGTWYIGGKYYNFDSSGRCTNP